MPIKANERIIRAIETYKPATHDNPTYVIDGVIHYGAIMYNRYVKEWNKWTQRLI